MNKGIEEIYYCGRTVRVGNCFYMLSEETHCGIHTGRYTRTGSAALVGAINDNIGIFKRAGENTPTIHFMSMTELIPDAWMCECGTITQMERCPVCTNTAEVNPDGDCE